MDIDIRDESNIFTSGIKKNDFDLYPVSPETSGEGLPYAPVGWPNPGDKWIWRVGKRILKSGHFRDRFLYLPRCLQKPTAFRDKKSLFTYFKEVDPDFDVDAFFASFSWKIPAKRDIPVTPEFCPELGEEVEQVKEEIPFTLPQRKRKSAKLLSTAIYKRRTRQSTKLFSRSNANDTGVIDLNSSSRESEASGPKNKDLQGTTDLESGQVSSHQAVISPPGTCIEIKVIYKDFDNFVNSLDQILTQPLPEAPLFPPETDNSGAFEEEMDEARRKLSSYLAMDFHLLACSEDLSELAFLSSKLQKDPSLTADQRSKLKLIEEIPAIAKDFLEATQTIEEINKFFADVSTNKDKAISLKNVYNASKKDMTILQADIDSSSTLICKIDAQIAQLQSQRAELIGTLETKSKEVAELMLTQKMAVDSLQEVVHKVQWANRKQSDWEHKKENASKRKAEILAWISPLKGIVF